MQLIHLVVWFGGELPDTHCPLLFDLVTVGMSVRSGSYDSSIDATMTTETETVELMTLKVVTQGSDDTRGLMTLESDDRGLSGGKDLY